jgi:hypothetical protein
MRNRQLKALNVPDRRQVTRSIPSAIGAILIVACGVPASQLEELAEQGYSRCMSQRGLPTNDVEIRLSPAREYLDMDGTYPGQGESAPDSASGDCLKEILDELSIPYELP